MTAVPCWDQMAERLIRAVRAREPRVEEGRVFTPGPARYRRLDCGGRALAYVFPRPRKRCLRIELSPAWRAPSSPRLAVASASGTALVIRTEEDLLEAVECLVAAARASER